MTEQLNNVIARAKQLCEWIGQTPHQRGSINGLAAQVGHELRALTTSQPAQAGEVDEQEFVPTNDFLGGHQCGLEWAAGLVEYNDPRTGDWFYDDRNDLADAIRKGPPDLPTQPAAQPVEVTDCMVNAALSAAGFFSTAESRKDMRKALMAALNSQPAAQATPTQQAAGEPAGEVALLVAEIMSLADEYAEAEAKAGGLTGCGGDIGQQHELDEDAAYIKGRLNDAVNKLSARATHPAPGVPEGFALVRDDLDLCRQWFDCIRDVHGGYLDRHDYELAKKLYTALGMRVPNSIDDLLAAAQAKGGE